MGKHTKKAVLVCVFAMLVFGFLSRTLGGYQREAKNEIVTFLKIDCAVDGKIVGENGLITMEGIAAIKKEFGDWRDQRKKDLWDRYRYYDYWLSVCKTLLVVSLFIIIFIGLRALLSRIYISEKVYSKFRQVDKDGDRN